VRAKEIFAAKRIPTPKWMVYDGGDPERFASKIEDGLSYPLVVKPRRGGSTIGVMIVEDGSDLLCALSGAGELLIEEFIPGRELTVGILRGDGADSALPIVEIEGDDRLFDYRAKYTAGVARFIPGMTPMSDLPRAAKAAGIGFEELVERMLKTAEKEER